MACITPNQAHPKKSTPGKVTTDSSFKTNIPMQTGRVTPDPKNRLCPTTFPTQNYTGTRY